jgi:hypothetical protein
MKGFERIDDALDLNVPFALRTVSARMDAAGTMGRDTMSGVFGTSRSKFFRLPEQLDLTGAEEINRRRLDVVSPRRTLFGTSAHCAVSSAILRRFAWRRLLVSHSVPLIAVSSVDSKHHIARSKRWFPLVQARKRHSSREPRLAWARHSPRER